MKGFAAVDKVALINLEGSGMIGIPGVSQRLFGALKDVGISVILISQASSEHSICFCRTAISESSYCFKQWEKSFSFFELEHGQIQKVQKVEPCTILGSGLVTEWSINLESVLNFSLHWQKQM